MRTKKALFRSGGTAMNEEKINVIRVNPHPQTALDYFMTTSQKREIIGNKDMSWKAMLQNYHHVLSPLECVGWIYFDKDNVRKNIKRLNDQTLRLPDKKWQHLVKLENSINYRKHTLTDEEALILIRAGYLYSVPPLLIVTENMKTPLEYACEVTGKQSFPPVVTEERLNEELKLMILGSAGSYSKWYCKNKINSKRVRANAPLIRSSLLSHITQSEAPYELWLLLYDVKRILLSDYIIEYYEKILQYQNPFGKGVGG